MGTTSQTGSAKDRGRGLARGGRLLIAVLVTSLLASFGVLLAEEMPAAAETADRIDGWPATAAYNDWNSDESQFGVHPQWMANIPDDTGLDELSIPATHDTMSLHGPSGHFITYTQALCGGADMDDTEQEACKVRAQLDAGIRYLDIRTECKIESGEKKLNIYHGTDYQYGELLDDVIEPLYGFLADHPRETVLVNVVHEFHNDDGCTWDETLWDEYLEPETTNAFTERFWWNCADSDVCDGTTNVANAIPTLGTARGKIVLLMGREFPDDPDDPDDDNDNPMEASGYYIPSFGTPADIVKPTDEGYIVCEDDFFDIAACRDFDDKWELIKSELNRADDTDKAGKLVISDTVGSTYGSTWPYRVAAGTEDDDGMNERLLDALRDGDYPRTGIVLMDFPGPSLIEQIIHRSTALYRGNTVGVLVDEGTDCPFTSGGVIEPINIKMDNEDDENENEHEGWIGDTNQGVNTELRFCRVDGNQLKRMPGGTYGVLKLDKVCPGESVTAMRRIDDEDDDQDSDSANLHYGDILPNDQHKNTILYFCIFQGDSASTEIGFPQFGFRYGVFANPDFGHAKETGSIYMDDEDSGNTNSIWDPYGLIGTLLTHGPNTKFKVARVTASPTFMTLSSSENPAWEGTTVTLTAGDDINAAATGTICLVDKSGTVTWPCQARLPHGNTFTLTEPGTHELVATYSGDFNFNASQATLTHTIMADDDPPVSTISFPNTRIVDRAAWEGHGAITGTTADNSGEITSLELSLRRESDGFWWDADTASFTATPDHVSKGNVSSWVLQVGATDLADGETYTTFATATDRVGNVEDPPTSFRFTFIDAAATAQIAHPVDGRRYSIRTWAGPSVCSAQMTGGVCGELRLNSETIDALGVQIKRGDGFLWDGAGFVGGTELYRPAVVVGNGWSVPIHNSAFDDNQTYEVSIRATASPSGNVLTDTATFTWDGAPPPPPAFTFPTDAAPKAAAAYNAGCNPDGICGTMSSGEALPAARVTLRITGNGPNRAFNATLGAGTWVVPLSIAELGGSGTYTLSAQTFDQAGNGSTVTQRTLVVDVDAPVGQLTGPVPDNAYNTGGYNQVCATTGKVCGTAADPAGVTKVEVAVQEDDLEDGSPGRWWNGTSFVFNPSSTVYVIAAGTTSWTVPLPASALVDGRHRVFLRTTDALGNVAESFAGAFVIDNVGPTGEVHYPRTLALLEDGTRPTELISAKEWDAGCTPTGVCGIAEAGDAAEIGVRLRADDGPFAGEYVTGDAGDLFTPTNFFLSASVNTATGVWKLPLDRSVLPDGRYTLTVRARDAQGNYALISGTPEVPDLPIELDSVVPVATVVPDNGQNEAGWITGATPLGFTVTSDDPDAECVQPAPYTGPEAEDIAVFGACFDPAGNRGEDTLTFSYDNTAPHASVAAARAPDVNGWYNAPFTATWSGTDARSGIAACSAVTYSGPDTSSGEMSGTCTDVAGLESNAAELAFKYDATDPTFDVRSPGATVVYGAFAEADFSCLDATSGIVSCTSSVADGAALDTSSVGPRSFTITAKDQAGNEVQHVVSYEVVKATPSVALTIVPSPSTYGQTPVAAVTITGPLAPPTGTVQFAVDGVNVGGPVTLVGGEGQMALPGMNAGTRTVTASYSGDANHNSTGNGVHHLVNKAPTTLVAHPALLSLKLGPGLSITASTSPSATLTENVNGTRVAGKTIVFRSNGTEICRAVTASNGTATCTGPLPLVSVVLGLGYRADFAGDGNLLPSGASGALIRIG